MAEEPDPRFDRAVELFRNALTEAGLRPIKTPKEEASTGWYSTVAKWPGRPNICVYFDRWLETPEQHFWFGFEGSKDQLAKLANDIDGAVRVPIKYPSDFKNVPDAAVKHFVETNGGFVYEQHAKPHYLGVYDVGFPLHEPDAVLVSQAAAFIIDLIKIAELSRRKPTDRLALILARQGQGEFRERLDNIWEGRCAVTKCSVRQALRASHIKPWTSSTDEERLSGENGLLLTATLDALFDSFLISFGDDGRMLFSPSLPAEERKLLMLEPNSRLSRSPPAKQKEYLLLHRAQSEQRYGNSMVIANADPC